MRQSTSSHTKNLSCPMELTDINPSYITRRRVISLDHHNLERAQQRADREAAPEHTAPRRAATAFPVVADGDGGCVRAVRAAIPVRRRPKGGGVVETQSRRRCIPPPTLRPPCSSESSEGDKRTEIDCREGAAWPPRERDDAAAHAREART